MKPGRNDPCTCGSGLKYKKCCGSSAATEKPRNVQEVVDRAVTLHQSGFLNEAASLYREALSVQPRNGNALHLLGVAEYQMGNYRMGIELINQSIPLLPGFAETYINLGRIYRDAGMMPEAIASTRKGLAISPNHRVANANYLLFLQYDESITPEGLRDAHEKWGKRAERGVTPYRRYANDPTPEKRLRIGYVSPDFGRHPVGYFLLPVLEAHDRQAVSITCYSVRHDEDELTEKFRSVADEWRPVKGLTEKELAEQVRSDGIDVLVDLAGHTAHSRLAAFAMKPAPVQVSWLGYPGSTGLSAIEYRLTDDIADPPEKALSYAGETLVRLPHGFLAYAPPQGMPDVVSRAKDSAAGIKFCSFNALAKVNRTVIEAWAKILHAVPESRLVLKGHSLADADTCARILQSFGTAGIAEDRVELRSLTRSLNDHFVSYNEMDLALDTFPYNGTTTTFEALWMGVPVITIAGNRHCARVGASILTRMGLPELVAGTLDEYCAIARQLAADTAKRRELRGTLRERLKGSRLCDISGFTRSLESAYREMWTRWCTKS